MLCRLQPTDIGKNLHHPHGYSPGCIADLCICHIFSSPINHGSIATLVPRMLLFHSHHRRLTVVGAEPSLLIPPLISCRERMVRSKSGGPKPMANEKAGIHFAVFAVTQRCSRILSGVQVDFVLDLAAVAGAGEFHGRGWRVGTSGEV